MRPKTDSADIFRNVAWTVVNEFQHTLGKLCTLGCKGNKISLLLVTEKGTHIWIFQSAFCLEVPNIS